MKKSSLLVSLLLLSYILLQVEGIRLGKRLMQLAHQNSLMEEKSSLIEKSNGIVGEVIVCKEHCNKGLKSENGRKANFKSDSKQITDHEHVELVDIVEMDYSPARRKSPIHN